MSKIDQMKIFYISRGREKEKTLLEYLQKKSLIQYKQFHFSTKDNPSTIINIITAFIKTSNISPNIILCEGLGLMSLISLLLAKISKSKLILRVKGDPYLEYEDVQMHGNLKQKIATKVQFRVTAYSLRNADLILPISKHIKTKLMDSGVKNIGKVLHIPLPKEKSLKDSLKDRPLEEYVLTVTNFNFYKKIEILLPYIEIIAPILRSNHIKWYIVGGGRHLDHIKNNLICKTHKDVVFFTNHQDPSPYYNSAIAQLYFSGLDSLSNVVLESFSYNIPVLVNIDFPVIEVIKESNSVVILDIKKPTEIKKLLEKTLYSKTYRDRLNTNAKNFLKNFTIKTLSEKLLDEFINLTNKKK